MATLTVTINGTSRSPLARGSSITLEQRRPTARLVVPDLTASLSFSVLQTVLVEDGSGTDLFSGYILRARKTRGRRRAGQLDWELDCVGKAWRAAHPPQLITASYASETDQNIAIDLVTQAGLSGVFTATSGTVDQTKTGITTSFVRMTLEEALDQLASLTGAHWFFDPADTLHWNADANAADAPWDVNTDAPNNSTTFDVMQLWEGSNADELANDIVVRGGNDATGTYSATASDSTSKTAYGTFQKALEDAGWTTQSTVDEIADAAVATYKDPGFEFGFTTRRDGLLPNQEILLTCAAYGLSAKAGVIRRVEYQQETDTQTLYRVTGGDRPSTLETLMRKLAGEKTTAGATPKTVRGLDFLRTSSEYVASGTTIPNLDDMAAMSIMITFSVDSAPAATRFGVVEKYDAAANTGWRLTIFPTGSVEFYRTKTTSDYQRSRSMTISVGGVYTLVCVASAIAAPRFWLDGAELTSGGGSSLGSGTLHSEVGDAVKVATYDGGNYFDGFLCDLAIWDIALPETTAASVHQSDINSLPFGDNVQLVWRMDEFAAGNSATGSGTILDRSGNGYNGTPSNTPTGAERIKG